VKENDFNKNAVDIFSDVYTFLKKECSKDIVKDIF
jgi:hypothetical protein